MNILAMEPYYGGSHRAFLDDWIAESRHSWTLLTLPANKWKWRMRHSAVTLADRARDKFGTGKRWDLLFCSDMLNLAEFIGLAPPEVRSLPSVAYFHENQLTYPVQHEKEYDYHFAFSNMNTALAAQAVWFNSEFHRDSFLTALDAFLRRMPDHQPLHAVEAIHAKSSIIPPGIAALPQPGERRASAASPHPLHILWAARWEHDKDPDTFFCAIDQLASTGVDFQLSVIGGGNARDVLPVFEEARHGHADRIRHWGYLETREAYLQALSEADVAVSTAQHEFFGISIVEAIAAGAYPLVPDRLAYPEVIGSIAGDNAVQYIYDGSEKALAARLTDLATRVTEAGTLWTGPSLAEAARTRYAWPTLAPAYDAALAALP